MDKAPILIIGSGRSGTTWLQDCLAQANRLRTVFEPLHPAAVPDAQSFANRYLTAGDDEPQLRLLFSSALKDQLNSIWARYRVRSDRLRPSGAHLLSASALKLYMRSLRQLGANYLRHNRIWTERSRRVIVKCIRANLMLEWILCNFDVLVIYLLRHPGAVAASKLSAGGESWDLNQAFQQQVMERYQTEGLLNTYGGNYDKQCDNLSAVAMHTMLWCVENALPMRVAERAPVCVVHYEHLLQGDLTEWHRVCAFADLEMVPNESSRAAPSEQALGVRAGSAFGPEQVSRWMETLSEQALGEIQAILDMFGVHCYRAFSPHPVALQDVGSGEPRVRVERPHGS